MFSTRIVNISIAHTGYPDTIYINTNNFSQNRSNNHPYSLTIFSLYRYALTY